MSASTPGNAHYTTDIATEVKLLGLVTHDAGGGGDCMALALADQLGLPPGRAGAAIVRRAITDYQRSHPDDFVGFIAEELDSDPENSRLNDMPEEQAEKIKGFFKEYDWAGYCDFMAQPGMYMSDFELIATCAVYQVRIHLIASWQTLLFHPADRTPRATLFLSFNHHIRHYQSLRLPGTQGSGAANVPEYHARPRASEDTETAQRQRQELDESGATQRLLAALSEESKALFFEVEEKRKSGSEERAAARRERQERDDRASRLRKLAAEQREQAQNQAAASDVWKVRRELREKKAQVKEEAPSPDKKRKVVKAVKKKEGTSMWPRFGAEDRLNSSHTRETKYSTLVGKGGYDGSTPILMADGTTMPLRHIRAGDRVLTEDGSALVLATYNKPSPVVTLFFRRRLDVLICAPDTLIPVIEEDWTTMWNRIKGMRFKPIGELSIIDSAKMDLERILGRPLPGRFTPPGEERDKPNATREVGRFIDSALYGTSWVFDRERQQKDQSLFENRFSGIPMLSMNPHGNYSVVSGCTGDPFAKWFVVEGTEAKALISRGGYRTEFFADQSSAQKAAVAFAYARAGANKGRR